VFLAIAMAVARVFCMLFENLGVHVSGFLTGDVMRDTGETDLDFATDLPCRFLFFLGGDVKCGRGGGSLTGVFASHMG
jgi:hypothetical protein